MGKIAWRKRIIKILLFIILLVVSIMLLDRQIRPVVETMSISYAKILAEQSINNTVNQILEDNKVTQDDLIALTRNSEGNITDMRVNSMLVNKLKTQLSDGVLTGLTSLEEQDLSIPLGTLSGVQIFSGLGPNIHIRVIPATYVDTKIISTFTSSGVNQTVHRIVFQVVVDISAIVPGFVSTGQIESDMVFSETVIVGTVPNSFAQITL